MGHGHPAALGPVVVADFVVVGAGVVGVAIARELARRAPDAKVVLLDKELAVGLHASGRNSGVLHAGLYYGESSLKARYAQDGTQRLSAWCEANDVPVNRCGKLVVARDERDHAGLDELARRAGAAGVPVERVDEDEARRIEPRARTVGQALWSPTTSSVDPARVLSALLDDARRAGVLVRLGAAFRRWDAGSGTVVTADGDISCGTVVNCAGLYADRVAAAFGAGSRYRILPFTGLYLRGAPSVAPLRVHVYPVPDLRFPFLGVHLTVTVDGGVKIGPTALPAPWREAYGGLSGFSAGELVDVVWRELGMFLFDASFRRLAFREAPKLLRGTLLREAASLVTGIDPASFTAWGRPGIRAQLLEVATRRLVDDFVVEEADGSLHVLNAVSPGFTCALPFAEHVVDQLGVR